jgi:4-hydroxy-tetrahydrodipicolinate synthase
MTRQTLQGIYTALMTSFKNGAVNARAFQELVAWQVREGVHGLVPCGTTGESPTLSQAEHHQVFDLCIEPAGKVPIMAGTGSNSHLFARGKSPDGPVFLDHFSVKRR